jgi:two-component system, OmpR family, response regulator CpxR
MAMKCILCVDDDPSALELRKLLLGAAGYSVLTAGSGTEALEVLDKGANVDLALLDYMMPGMNGDELAEKLRRQHPGIPLVAVSAVGQLPQAFLNNLDSRVQKGQDPEVLLSTVSNVLARSETGYANVPPKTILCVEDEEWILTLREKLFESVGFTVLKARSGAQAMELFRAHHVDAVVLDYFLSGMNGTAVATEMKRLRPRIPIVMLSGFASLPGEGAVVDAWLRKGDVEPEDLIKEVSRLIEPRAGTPRSTNF